MESRHGAHQRTAGHRIGSARRPSAAARRRPDAGQRLARVFRAGQDFLTWKEVAGEGVAYKVYRKTAPIRGADRLRAALAGVGEVGACLEPERDGLDRPARPSADKTGELYEIPERVYFILKEGEAPCPTTGLFVYTRQASGGRLLCGDGGHRRGRAGRRLGGREHPGRSCPGGSRIPPGDPANQTDYVHWIDDVGTEFYPAMGNRPGLAYNFRLEGAPGAAPVPLHGLLHGALFQYNTPDAPGREARRPGHGGLHPRGGWMRR